MKNINEYIKLSREERRKHLLLEEPCSEIGGDSRQFRALLAYHLGTTIPSGMKIHLCHACHNGNCSNKNHLYWGTPSDNIIDLKESGNFVCYAEKTRNKMGEENYRQWVRLNGSKAGKMSPHYFLTDEQLQKYKSVFTSIDCNKRGWIMKARRELNVSHTHVRRIYNRIMVS